MIQSNILLCSCQSVRAGEGVAKNYKNAHVWCGSVRDEKLLCTECASVPKLVAHK